MNYLVAVASKILGFVASPFQVGGWENIEDRIPEDFAWIKNVVDAITMILWPLLIVVGAAGMIYAVILGVNMARADSTEKREEAKKRLINVIVGMAIVIGLILFMQLFMYVIMPNFIPTVDLIPAE